MSWKHVWLKQPNLAWRRPKWLTSRTVCRTRLCSKREKGKRKLKPVPEEGKEKGPDKDGPDKPDKDGNADCGGGDGACGAALKTEA